MKVGEFPDEEAYIQHRMKKYEEKKAGKGAKWRKEWFEIKEYAETGFIKTINKKLKKYGILFSLGDESALYTLVMDADSLEIGWSGGIVSSSAVIIWAFSLCKTGDLDHPIANAATFGIGDAESVRTQLYKTYSFTGLVMAKFLKKQVFK